MTKYSASESAHDVCCCGFCIAVIRSSLSFGRSGERKNLLFKLGNAFELTGSVVHKTATAGFGALDKTADADILYIKSGGFVIRKPLLFKSRVESADTLCDLFIFVFGKAAKRFLVTFFICGTCACAEVILYSEYFTKLCFGIKDISIFS